MSKVTYEIGDTSRILNGLHESLLHRGKSQLSKRYNEYLKENPISHGIK